jgi:hypothetical protein
MKKLRYSILTLAFWTVLAVLGLGVAAWAEYSLVVVSPTETLPEGVTMVIPSIDKRFSAIGSVEAYCERCMTASLWCKVRTYRGLEEAGAAVFELPYSETLFRLTRATISTWQRIEAEGEL